MTDHTDPTPTPSPRKWCASFGIAPALSQHETTDKLVESIRSQTDDAVAAAKARLAHHEREEAHEQSLRPANWATGGEKS